MSVNVLLAGSRAETYRLPASVAAEAGRGTRVSNVFGPSLPSVRDAVAVGEDAVGVTLGHDELRAFVERQLELLTVRASEAPPAGA